MESKYATAATAEAAAAAACPTTVPLLVSHSVGWPSLKAMYLMRVGLAVPVRRTITKSNRVVWVFDVSLVKPVISTGTWERRLLEFDAFTVSPRDERM